MSCFPATRDRSWEEVGNKLHGLEVFPQGRGTEGAGCFPQALGTSQSCRMLIWGQTCSVCLHTVELNHEWSTFLEPQRVSVM